MYCKRWVSVGRGLGFVKRSSLLQGGVLVNVKCLLSDRFQVDILSFR